MLLEPPNILSKRMPASILCGQRTGNSLIVSRRSKPICFLLKKDPCLHPNPSAALHSRFASSWNFTIEEVFGAVQEQAPLSCSQKGIRGPLDCTLPASQGFIFSVSCETWGGGRAGRRVRCNTFPSHPKQSRVLASSGEHRLSMSRIEGTSSK